MLTKTCFAAIAASLLLAPVGVAYSGDKSIKDTSKAPNAENLTELTKSDAMKNGITEKQFSEADKNHNGKLDKEEMKGAGLEGKMKTSQ